MRSWEGAFWLIALSVMINSDIAVPETHSFTSYEEALSFVEETKDRLVYKPEKELGDLSPSHVSYDQEDMLDFLKNVQEYSRVEDPEFILQRYEKGLEISSEGWFDGYEWLPLFNHTFERKQLMDGNNGPSGGCTGNITWACDGNCPICEAGIRRMLRFLKENHYQGPIDLNAIVTEEALFGLEFTPRLGYDASPTLLSELLDGELSEFFSSIAKGTYDASSPAFSQDNKLAGGIKISIPPWPTEKYKADSNVPIAGLEKSDFNHTYLYNVKKHPEDPQKLVSAGAWGLVCLFTGSGTSVSRCLSRPYDLAEKVRIPDKQFRTDLVDQFKEDMEKLAELVGEEYAVV
jgi:phosphoribosylamine-glycine ligase